MKLKFKKQAYQTRAVKSVIDCFAGQLRNEGMSYKIDPGKKAQTNMYELGFKNADIQLSDTQLINNIWSVQEQQNLPMSQSLFNFTETDKSGKLKPKPNDYKPGAAINLDIEMETGTGKTYCYIKTMFEMHKFYGWSKFIIVVPNIAIREGVRKSLEITEKHFQEIYDKKANFFIYNSKKLADIENFSSDAGIERINVMVINIQAFNASGKDNRRIYEKIDDFQSRAPIEVIKKNRPILILDEPQKMEGKATLKALPKFNPLMILRYSATHKTNHNKIHRLDAVDAYQHKLVKKIAVLGISLRNLSGSNAYLCLESIEVSNQEPVARIKIEVKQSSGIKRLIRKIKKDGNLYDLSNELDQYKDFVIADISAITDTVEFTNGHELQAGGVIGDITEDDIRRLQIRETIKAHLDKEKQLFAQGIKVLSLLFIDSVVKYREYARTDNKGEYARTFESEYTMLKDEYLSELAINDEAYRKYLDGIDVTQTHKGYFSIDKKGKMVDAVKAAKSERVESTDQSAYDLILKDKERLLSFEEPTRFIFSHSALREGWDNPNVFVICTLKHSNNIISRRQEVGRGLRISVNQLGDRQDDPATVHDINVLTVIASESYEEFVTGLQGEISESLSARPRVADAKYFTGKTMKTADGKVEVTKDMAEGIEFYLIQNGYVDSKKNLAQKYHDALKNEELADFPEDLQPYKEQIFHLIDSVYSDAKLPQIENARGAKTNPRNANFEKKEFKELWNRINRKAFYRVEFDSDELTKKCICTLNKELHVSPIQYDMKLGEQADRISHEQVEDGSSFVKKRRFTKNANPSHSAVKYDLLGKLSENVQLTRKTLAAILTGIEKTVFAQFETNPEDFIRKASTLITEQKDTIIIEHLSYHEIDAQHNDKIFLDQQSIQDFSKAKKGKKHIYDYVIIDSNKEEEFAKELDASSEVVVYAKLPKTFSIPTPVGNYTPDWAISFKEGSTKHIYFVVETKGSMSSSELRKLENIKIECARKFFDEINHKTNTKSVKYAVVDSFNKLMEIVGVGTV